MEFCSLAAELSTKNMTVQERAQFMKAKVSELESFFENGVWTADWAGNSDPKRTLKGKFMLKWATNPDGTQGRRRASSSKDSRIQTHWTAAWRPAARPP